MLNNEKMQELYKTFNLDYIAGYKKGYEEASIETANIFVRDVKHILEINDNYKNVAFDLLEDIYHISLRIIRDNVKGEDMVNAF
jgi:hypothetical protein